MAAHVLSGFCWVICRLQAYWPKMFKCAAKFQVCCCRHTCAAESGNVPIMWHNIPGNAPDLGKDQFRQSGLLAHNHAAKTAGILEAYVEARLTCKMVNSM